MTIFRNNRYSLKVIPNILILLTNNKRRTIKIYEKSKLLSDHLY
jgi:hypothetical protein